MSGDIVFENGIRKQAVSGAGGGGGGTAVTEADGANVALGSRADTPATTDSGTFSLIALVKRLLQKLTAGVPVWGPDAVVTIPTKPPIFIGGQSIVSGELLPLTTDNIGNLMIASYDTLNASTTPGPALFVPILVRNGVSNTAVRPVVRGNFTPTHDDAANNVLTGAVSVGTTATAILGARTTFTNNRRAVRVFNNGATTVYVGATTGVTAATGYPIPAGAGQVFSVNTILYGIVTAGTADVRFFEEYY